MSRAQWNRKLHRRGAILGALGVIVIFVTGAILQLKKDWAWVQPPTLHGSSPGEPRLTFAAILAAVRAVPEAGIEEWGDIDRLDVRPGKGMLKVRGKNCREIQLDARTGAVLSSTYRRSDWIESIHDGTWFAPGAKLWIWLPTAFLLCFLWCTGMYLWFLPHLVRRRRRARLH